MLQFLIKLYFVNKAMGMINNSKIINGKNVNKNLPTQFNRTNFNSIYIN